MQTPEFHIEVRDDGHLLVLILHGELDLATVSQVHEAIAQHCTGRTAMVIDLSPLEFMDSTGIRLIIELWNRRDGTHVAFIAPTGEPAKVLEIAGVRPMITWITDAAQALDSDIPQ